MRHTITFVDSGVCTGLSTAVGTCESGRNESGGGAGDGETTEVTTSFIFLFFSRAAVAIIFGPVKSRKVLVPPGF